MKIKLAEALLRRKELQAKVDQLSRIKSTDLFETRARRVRVTDSIDDVEAQVPKLKACQVTEEYDYYAKNLRLIDSVIQNTNWTTEIEVDSEATTNYSERVQG